jgi:hypothetical protein
MRCVSVVVRYPVESLAENHSGELLLPGLRATIAVARKENVLATRDTALRAADAPKTSGQGIRLGNH